MMVTGLTLWHAQFLLQITKVDVLDANVDSNSLCHTRSVCDTETMYRHRNFWLQMVSGFKAVHFPLGEQKGRQKLHDQKGHMWHRQPLQFAGTVGARGKCLKWFEHCKCGGSFAYIIITNCMMLVAQTIEKMLPWGFDQPNHHNLVTFRAHNLPCLSFLSSRRFSASFLLACCLTRMMNFNFL